MLALSRSSDIDALRQESEDVGRKGARRGYENSSVALRALGDASDALTIISEHHRRKTSNELKPFAVVEVEASTVSMMDCLIRRDRFLRKAPCKNSEAPYSMGCDMVGRVVQAGKGAKSFGISKGDRVCAMDFNLGGNSRYVFVPCYDLMKVPRSLDPCEAVCLLRPYITAYQCLHRVGGRELQRGDRVLVIGGTGCVGQAVIELALEGGAKAVYATGNGPKDKMLITAKGAKYLGREPEEWLPYVEGKMDIVIDSVCSDGFKSSYDALRNYDSKLVCVGATAKQNDKDYLSMFNTDMNVLKASYFMRQTTFYDLLSRMEASPMEYAEDLKGLFQLLMRKRIKPRIAMRVSLEEVIDAHEAIEEGGLNGNVVCQPNVSRNHLASIISRKSAESRDSADPLRRGGYSHSRDEDQSDDSDIDELQASDDRSSSSSESSASESFGTFDDESTLFSEMTNESSMISDASNSLMSEDSPSFPSRRVYKKPAALSTIEETEMQSVAPEEVAPSGSLPGRAGANNPPASPSASSDALLKLFTFSPASTPIISILPKTKDEQDQSDDAEEDAPSSSVLLEKTKAEEVDAADAENRSPANSASSSKKFTLRPPSIPVKSLLAKTKEKDQVDCSEDQSDNTERQTNGTEAQADDADQEEYAEDQEDQGDADYATVRTKEEKKRQVKNNFWWKRSFPVILPTAKREGQKEKNLPDASHVSDGSNQITDTIIGTNTEISEAGEEAKLTLDTDGDKSVSRDGHDQGQSFTSFFASFCGDEGTGGAGGIPTNTLKEADAYESASRDCPDQSQKSSTSCFTSCFLDKEESGSTSISNHTSKEEKEVVKSEEVVTNTADATKTPEGGNDTNTKTSPSATFYNRLRANCARGQKRTRPASSTAEGNNVPDSEEKTMDNSSMLETLGCGAMWGVLGCELASFCTRLWDSKNDSAAAHAEATRRPSKFVQSLISTGMDSNKPTPSIESTHKPDPDLGNRIEYAASKNSSDSSTFIAAGVTFSYDKSDDADQIERKPANQINASKSSAGLKQGFPWFKALDFADSRQQKGRVTKGLKKQRSTGSNPSKSREVSVPASRTFSSRQSVTSSPVSVQCDNTERPFNVPSMVANSVMSVTSDSNSHRSQRNIYSTRKSPSPSTQRMLPPSHRRRSGGKRKTFFKKS